MRRVLIVSHFTEEENKVQMNQRTCGHTARRFGAGI